MSENAGSNPYSSPDDVPEPVAAELAEPGRGLTNRETYNIVADVATGVNIRAKDNLVQAACIGATTVLGVAVGGLGWWCPEGAVLGGAAGLLVGLFGSGIFLMIYRAVKHVRGDHR
ncbi:MAG: hypothetical protein JW809_16830 [Pirellulales bacterium]|nr:hypothetical protein [Pirellulales bacterium]